VWFIGTALWLAAHGEDAHFLHLKCDDCVKHVYLNALPLPGALTVQERS